MGHIETSLLCVTCILVTVPCGLSQQLLFALDCQMNGCSHRLYWGFLGPLCPLTSRFPRASRLESRASVEANFFVWSPFYRWQGPSIFSSVFPEFNTHVGNRIRRVIPDTWLHLSTPSDYGSASWPVTSAKLILSMASTNSWTFYRSNHSWKQLEHIQLASVFHKAVRWYEIHFFR